MRWNSAGGLDRMLCGYLRLTLDGVEVQECYAFDTAVGVVFCYDSPARIGDDGWVARLPPQHGRVEVELLPDAPALQRQLFEIATSKDVQPEDSR